MPNSTSISNQTDDSIKTKQKLPRNFWRSHRQAKKKVFKKSLDKLNGKSIPCSSTRPPLCYVQIANRQKFKSTNKRVFNIFHLLT